MVPAYAIAVTGLPAPGTAGCTILDRGRRDCRRRVVGKIKKSRAHEGSPDPSRAPSCRSPQSCGLHSFLDRDPAQGVGNVGSTDSEQWNGDGADRAAAWPTSSCSLPGGLPGPALADPADAWAVVGRCRPRSARFQPELTLVILASSRA